MLATALLLAMAGVVVGCNGEPSPATAPAADAQPTIAPLTSTPPPPDTPTPEPTAMTTFSFSLFDAAGTEFEMPFITIPSPGIEVELFPGGQHRGWVAFAVPVEARGIQLAVDPTFSSRVSRPGSADRYFAIP